MSPRLLDVNVLIALLDPSHIHHERAHHWFAAIGQDDWLTSPTTQNGVARIVSNARYANSQPLPVVMDSLESLLEVGRHRFVSDSATLLDPAIDRTRLLSSGQVTDTYLIAVAAANGAQLATFDRRIATVAVPGGQDAVLQIP